jgi:hypothetical protein
VLRIVVPTPCDEFFSLLSISIIIIIIRSHHIPLLCTTCEVDNLMEVRFIGFVPLPFCDESGGK